jgi:MoaA/NifB/PqqE/SkfB family radical SAM enzyme
MPKAIDLSIGETCNNNCTFCINPTETWAPLAETSRLLRTIEQCAAQGYERLSFLGGEPTLHPALPQLIRHAYAHGFHEVMLVTNGRKLADPAFAAEVAQAGIRRALFMLLSHDPAVHDGITRKPGSLAAALQGVVTARAAGIDVCANIPITRSNVGQLSETVAALVERGITQICFLYLTAYGNVLSHPGVLAPYDQAAVELRRACAEHDHHAELLIDNFPFCYLPGLEDRIQSEMANPWREIAYPSGSIVDVAEVYRFRKMRLPECDGCRWDAVCGGVQDTAQLDQIATELAQGLRRMRQLRGAPAE